MKMASGVAALLAAMAVGCSAIPTASAQKVELRQRLKPGDRFRTDLKSDQSFSATIRGEKLHLVQSIWHGYEIEVLDVDDDGNVTERVTYDSIVFEQHVGSVNVEYDSRAPQGKITPAVQPFAAITGESFTVKLTPTGKVLEVGGIDAMIEHALDKTEAAKGPERGTLRRQLNQQFGEQAVRQGCYTMFSVYPDHPVRVGQSWHARVATSNWFPMIQNSTWTLRKRRGGLSYIEVTTKNEPDPETRPPELQGESAAFSVSGITGESHGTVEVDEGTGLIRAAKLDGELSGTMTATGEKVPGSVPCPFSATITTTIKMTKRE
jgi:hypothetical protein